MSGGEQSGKPKFDLEERTAVFGEAVVRFAKKVPQNPVTIPLISQIVRSGTSVPITKRMTPVLKKISNIKSEFAEKKRVRPSSGCG